MGTFNSSEAQEKGDKMKTSSTWKTEPISCTCEVLRPYAGVLCDKPTTHAYPAMGCGWMALCARHAQKHIKHGGAIPTDELILRGEKWK